MMALAPETKISEKEIAKAEQIQPMWKIVLSQFLEHKAAVAGLFVILFFITVALCAPLIQKFSGIDPEVQNPLKRYQKPMTRVEASSDVRQDAITKFIEQNPEMAGKLQTDLVTNQLVAAALPTEPTGSETEAEAVPVEPHQALFDEGQKEVSVILSDMKTLGTPESKEFAKVAKDFETLHVLGTDELGRDVLMRLIFGTRVSMGVGVMVAIASTIIGLLIGSLAGFYGGVLDAILMRITDSLLSLPVLPVQIVIAAIDLNKLPLFKSIVGSQNESMIKLFFILLMFSWMTTALLVRGSVLSIREREFILAARTLGARDSTIIFRHMVPNVVAPLLVSVTLGVGESILFEAALSFLGLGIQQPTPSWGNMLMNAQDLISEAPFLAIIPGLLILTTAISFNYLGDGLQDAIDPKARGRS